MERGTLDLSSFDNSHRWWLGASVALQSVGYTKTDAALTGADEDLAELYMQHFGGKA